MAQVDVVLKPLRELLRSGVSKTSIRNALKRFECKRDGDVAFFLGTHAIQNEYSGASRTYLALEKRAFDEGALDVVAFVTLAITDTDYSGISEEDRRAILGSVPRVRSNDFFPGYLLAQLARADAYTHEDFDCSALLVFAEGLIIASSQMVGGHIVYLDCKEDLIGYYEDQGYSALYLDAETGLFKMVKHFGADVIDRSPR